MFHCQLYHMALNIQEGIEEELLHDTDLNF